MKIYLLYIILLTFVISISRPITSVYAQSANDKYVWEFKSTSNIVGADKQIQELRDEVQKILNTYPKHLAPLPLIYGDQVNEAGYAIYNEPGRVITTLAWAYPYLTDAQKTSVKQYVSSELASTNFAPWASNNLIPKTGTDVAPREVFARDRWWGSTTFGDTRPRIHVIYGLWLYAYKTGDYQLIQNNWSKIVSFYNARLSTKDSGNLYGTMGAHIAMARLADKFGDTSTKNTAISQLNSNLTAGLTLLTIERNAGKNDNGGWNSNYWTAPYKDIYMFGYPDTNTMSRKMSGIYPGHIFLNMTPEIGRYIKDNPTLSASVISLNNSGKAKFPKWWVTQASYFNRVTSDEGSGITPEELGKIYPVEKFVVGASKDVLKMYTKGSSTGIGDAYYLEALVQTIESYGTECYVDVRNASATCGAPNQTPNGTITLPTANITIDAGQTVNFQSTSSDPDNNTPITYTWDFGLNSGIAISTSQNPGPTVFNKIGTYTVTLTVKDSLGANDPTPDSRVVTVNGVTGGITTPINNATLSGQFSVSANYVSQGGYVPTSLTLYLDGNQIQNCLPPLIPPVDPPMVCSKTLTSSDVTVGNHTLKSILTTLTGLTYPSQVNIIYTNSPPTVNINSPQNNASFTVPANVNVGIGASDVDGTVSKVELYSNSTKVSESTSAPYNFVLNLNAAGNYSLFAKAFDNSSLSSTSPTINIILTNTSPQVSGLVSAYSFNKGSGNILDDSTGLNNGTIEGAVWDTAGKFDKALSFNGSTNKVTINDSSSLDLTSGMTLEAWVYPTAIGGWRTAVLKEQPTDLAYALYSDSDINRPRAYVNISGNKSSNGTSQVPINTWTHLATTYDGTSLKLYVNGALIASNNYPGQLLSTSNNLFIGGNTVWGEYFQGKIDEVRIYNTALSATQIQTDMNTPIGVGTTGGGTTNPPVNQLPVINITNPANNSTFVAPATINIGASASDSDGTISKVDFYTNSLGTLLATRYSAPYTFSWPNVAQGSYNINAKATDNMGATSLSPAVNFTVIPATTSSGTSPIINLLPNGNFESSPDLVNWDSASGATISTTQVHGGTKSLKITSGYTGHAWLALSANKNYEVTYYYKCNSLTSSQAKFVLFRYDWSNITETSSSDLAAFCGDNKWHKYALNFTLSAATNVRIELGLRASGTSDIYFDDITLFEKTNNVPPTASITVSPTTLNVGQSISATSIADDVDGAVSGYTWDFGDGGTNNRDSTTYTYQTSGNYIVKLTVVDDSLAQTSVSAPVTVNAVAGQPAITITSPTTASSYTSNSGTITLGGTIQGTISSITYDNIDKTDVGSINVASNWTSPAIPLKFGNNEILLTAITNDGKAVTAKISVYRTLTSPAINNIEVLTNSVDKYGKYEVRFDVDTVASEYFFKYDKNPPPGVTPEEGITVEGVFTQPDGSRVTMPGFYTAEVTRESSGHYVETAVKKWHVRFSPQTPGSYSLSINVTDKTGTVSKQASSFTVSDSSKKGFVRVSNDDKRFFQFSNGSLYFPVGPAIESDYTKNKASGLNFLRPWMGGRGAYSTNWSRWVSTSEQLGNEGFMDRLNFSQKYPNHELSHEIFYPEGYRVWMGWLDEEFKPNLKPNTNYRVKLRLKTMNIAGPRTAGQPYGFVIKPSDWPSEPFDDLHRSEASMVPILSQNRDWHTIVSTYRTPASGLTYINLYLDNVTAGQVYIDEFSMKEVNSDGSLGGELIRNPRADEHKYVESRPAAFFDWQIQQGEANDVYFQYVVQDKNDWIPNHLKSTGIFASTGDGYYQTDGTKNRWLQQQWWRYIIARWGYSTAVRSWELNNEGTPDGTYHYKATEDFAKFMNDNNPQKQLASTSFWCCWRPNFWGDNVNYPNVGYADVHEYTNNSDLGSSQDAFEKDTAGMHIELNKKIKLTPVNKPVIRAESGIMSQANFDLLKTTNSGLWYHNLIWAQLDSAVVSEPNYWFSEHLNVINRDQIATPFSQFLQLLDVNKGGYVDVGVTVSNTNIRVVGQKNMTKSKAYMWVSNKNNTWYNEMRSPSSIGSQSGSVVVKLSPNTSYKVKKYNTYSFTTPTETNITTDVTGNLTINIANLVKDEAYIIEPGSNAAPNGTIASPTGNITINVGDTVNFASTATDPDNNPVTYLWDFGLNSGLFTSTSQNPGVLRFNNIGVFDVKLTVKDSFGLDDPTPDVRTVTVNGMKGQIVSPIDGSQISLINTVKATYFYQGNFVPVSIYLYIGGTNIGSCLGLVTECSKDFNAGDFATNRYEVKSVLTTLTGYTYPAVATVNIVNKNPTININSPVDNSYYMQGSNIQLGATAYDEDGTISKVIFFSGTNNIGQVLSAPYNFTVNNVQKGDYQFKAIAYDNVQNSANSQVVNVHVTDSAVANSIITSPLNYSRIAQTTPVVANFGSIGTQAKADFYVDDIKVTSITDCVLVTTCTYNFNPSNYQVGIHKISVIGYSALLNASRDDILIYIGNESVAPTGRFLSPANNSTLTTSPVIISTEFTDVDSGLKSVNLMVNGSTVKTCTQFTITQSNTHKCEYSWDTASGLKNNVLKAVGTDLAGNSTEIQINVNLPNKVPTIQLVSPLNNTDYAIGSLVNISATASDTDGGVTKVEFYINNNLVSSDTSVPYSYTWQPSASGAYTILAKAYDTDNASVSSQSVVISVRSNIPPIATILKPTSSNLTIDKGGFVEFEGSGTDPDGNLPLRYLWTFSTNSGIQSIELAKPGSIRFDIVGIFKANFKVFDSLGSSSSTVNEVTIKVNAKPEITLITPNNQNPLFAAPFTLDITAVATDPDGNISKVEFYNNGTKVSEDTATPYTLSLPNLSAGDYVIRAAAYDNDNSMTDAFYNFKVFNNASPTISIISPSNDTNYVSPANIYILVSTTDPDGSIQKVEFYANGNKVGEDAESPYSINWVPSGDGSYVLTAKAIDNLNASGTSNQITVNVATNHAPDGLIISPISQTININSSLEFIGSASDPDNNALTYFWDFKGGASNSNAQNPGFVTFLKQGIYNIVLNVTDNLGLADPTPASVTIEVIDPVALYKPKAEFSVDDQSKLVGEAFNFTDLSTNSPTSYKWDFNNDGVVDSEVQNPSYTYSTDGKYSVSLKVSNTYGEDSMLKQDYITVSKETPTGEKPDAQFTVTNGYGYAPLTVKFTDTSKHDPTSWNWNFGDGTRSTERNPSHKYIKAGRYTVSLKVSNQYGSDTLTKYARVIVFPRILKYPITLGNVSSGFANQILGESNFDFNIVSGTENEKVEVTLDEQYIKTVSLVLKRSVNSKLKYINLDDCSSAASINAVLVSCFELESGDINPNLSSAEIFFSIPKKVLQDYKADKSKVIIYHLENNNWVKLPTSVKQETKDDVYYSTITKSFSNFVIGIDQPAQNNNKPYPTISSQQVNQSSIDSVDWGLYLLAGVIIAIIIAVVVKLNFFKKSI